MITYCKRLITLALVLVFLLFTHSSPALSTASDSEYQDKRSKLLSYIIQKKLTNLHFSHKKLDDALSKNAFDLYLKQLDSQKRFLLTQDVERLKTYSTKMDDEIISGRLQLPTIGAGMLTERAEQVRKIVREILAQDFDISRQEQLETDPEKLDFCNTEAELLERWRKTLKYQLISRYMNMLEDEGLPHTLPGKKNAPAAETSPHAKSSEEIWQEAKNKVTKSYDNFFSRILEADEQDHYDRYFNSIARAYDPHTNYLPPTKKEDFDIHMSGSLEGIGALLREEDGYIKVVRIIPGSASFRQGQLQAEDIILEVAEGDNEPVNIIDTRIRDAVTLIRGKKGTEVRLFVKKTDGTRLTIPIIRDVVQIEETFAKSILLEDEKAGTAYGYIKIPSFYRDFKGKKDGGTGRNVTDDVRQILVDLSQHKTDGLIIDLRINGGGALEDAVSVAGLFIKSGPIVQIKDSDGDIKILKDTDTRIDYNGPIVMLVSKFSASASEILAGALQDYKRALIVGSEHTHGKGTVQTMIDLNYNLPFFNMKQYRPLGALKVTTQKFYRISGDSTQFRGVTPDIILPDRMQHIESGEQYNDYSLPWDRVASTSYRTWPKKLTDVAVLQEKSRNRIKQSSAFEEIISAAKETGERSKETLLSINFDDIRNEFEKNRERKKKLSAAGLGHADLADETDETPNTMTEEKQKKLWIKEVADDPYIQEAESILLDMVTLEKKISKL